MLGGLFWRFGGGCRRRRGRRGGILWHRVSFDFECVREVDRLTSFSVYASDVQFVDEIQVSLRFQPRTTLRVAAFSLVALLSLFPPLSPPAFLGFSPRWPFLSLSISAILSIPLLVSFHH